VPQTWSLPDIWGIFLAREHGTVETKPSRRRYEESEARAILDRALRRDAVREGIEHDDLVAAAREVGISEETLGAAIQEVERSRTEDEVRRTIVRRRRRDLANHALAYLLICGSLTLVALFLTGGWWFLWPVILWGTGLVFHAQDALRRSVSDEETRRELRRRERAEERERQRLGEDQARARRLARNEALERGADQLGAAVEKGVALLMSKVADKIRTGIRPDAGPSSPRPPSGSPSGSPRSDEGEE
jgi:hypothetical protein